MKQVQINAKELSFHLLAVEILLTVEKKKKLAFWSGVIMLRIQSNHERKLYTSFFQKDKKINKYFIIL